jgi:hypothetical protein
MNTSNHYPKSPTGKRFCQFFNHRFNWIKALKFDENNKPNWFTITDYPIEHRNLWKSFISPDCLIGLSFGKKTHHTMIDLDTRSIYHPLNDEPKFKELLGIYEEAGLVEPIIVQSSDSGGIHVYFILPCEVETFKLSSAMKFVATSNGFTVKDGTLEIFPNTKAYNKHKPSAYKAHRLPLQQGSFLLDKDYQPYSNDVGVFLDLAESSALSQDMEILEKVIALASQAKQFRCFKGDSNKAIAFAKDLKEQIEDGWTDFHQTNDLLRVIGTYGRIFESLGGDDLVKYIVETALNSSGYTEFCRHQHEIEQRARDWGRCIEKFYYPYGTKPSREGTFASMQKKGEKESKNNIVNLNRATESKERIVQAVNYLKERFKQLPQKIGELKEMLLQALSELFSTRPSDKTLYKYKDLWHQKEIEEKATEGTSSQSLETAGDTDNNRVSTDDILTIPCEVEIVLEPTLEVPISNEVENILCEENTNLETPLTLISTDLENPSNSQEHNIQQLKPILHNGSRICPTPPNVVLEKKDEVKRLEPISDNGFKKSASPPPLYEGLLLLIKSWFNQKTVLSYQGVAMSGLAKASNEKRETLKSISPNQKVIITDYTHSSFLVNPENRENILVYVTPVSEINNWNMGIAVRAIYLFPLYEI